MCVTNIRLDNSFHNLVSLKDDLSDKYNNKKNCTWELVPPPKTKTNETT